MPRVDKTPKVDKAQTGAEHAEQLAVDIAIVGGGLVGASLANALLPLARRHALRLTLIEPVLGQRGAEVVASPSFDARATALSFGGRLFLERLGLWDAIAEHAEPIQEIHVSDQGRFGSTLLRAAEHQVPALGYVMTNAGFGAALYQSLSTAKELRILQDQVETLVPEPGGHQLTCEGGARLSAGLVVVADGGRSGLMQKLGIEHERQDYGQHAVIANLLMQRPHAQRAFERFTPQGPLALLPLRDAGHQGRAVALVLTLAEGEVNRVLALKDEDFVRLVQSRFGYRLGRILRVGARAHYPLTLLRATEQIRPGLLVMGNAAHSLHPIAGQGFNLALRGVAGFEAVLAEALAAGESLRDFAVLRRYLERRLWDQDRTITFTDQALRLFSNRDLLLSQLRGLGMLGLELVAPARDLFAKKAMGL